MQSSSLALRNDEPVVHGLLCNNPSPEVSEVIKRGQDAMANKRRAWSDWMLIAEALDAGRIEVMREIHTNQPTGRRYEKAMSEWLIKNGFKEIDKGTRCRALECLQHRDEIEHWRALLTDTERFRLNGPQATLQKWKKSTAVPDAGAKLKPSPFAQLKSAHVELLEEHHRLQREIDAGGGDLWTADDTASDIAAVMLGKLSPNKAKDVARAILKQLKEQRQ